MVEEANDKTSKKPTVWVVVSRRKLVFGDEGPEYRLWGVFDNEESASALKRSVEDASRKIGVITANRIYEMEINPPVTFDAVVPVRLL